MLIRNPINPHPQNITIDPNKEFIEFTFMGDRLGSYKVNIYSYSNTEPETLVWETDIINIENYAYNNTRIVLDHIIAGMNISSGFSYTWEVIMSPYKDLGGEHNTHDNFKSLRYFFETSYPPRILSSNEENTNTGFLINGLEYPYDHNSSLPHIVIDNLQTRILNVEGYYCDGNIKYYYFKLFDEDGNLIEETNKTFSGKIEYSFQGLLSPKKYTLWFYAVSQKEQYTTIVFDISTTYELKTNMVYPPILTCNREEANVKIEWAKDFTAYGKAEGEYTLDTEKGEVAINSGTIVYDNVSSFPIFMDKNNFAFGIKTTINDAITKIFDYINNDILYEVYMENYKIYLRYGNLDFPNKTIIEVCDFKNNILFGVQEGKGEPRPAADTGYMCYVGTDENGEEYTIPNSNSFYLLTSLKEAYKYEILLQNKNGIITCDGRRID